jgi:hypothetical protein
MRHNLNHQPGRKKQAVDKVPVAVITNNLSAEKNDDHYADHDHDNAQEKQRAVAEIKRSEADDGEEYIEDILNGSFDGNIPGEPKAKNDVLKDDPKKLEIGDDTRNINRLRQNVEERANKASLEN